MQAAFRVMRYELGPLRRPMGRMIIELRAEAPEGAGAQATGPVQGRLELTNVYGRISVRGHLSVPVALECSRCLEAYEEILEIEINEECALREIDAPESYEESEEEPCPIPILNDNELDLSELVRQLIAMHLPLRPLCRAECRGLCPYCGKDLNQGPCDCVAKAIDPRWAKLRDLFDEEGEEQD